MTRRIPLFPLNAVLFPGGVLPLRVFEPRYLDMVSNCLKTHSGIGVVLIREGREVGVAAETYEVGTLSDISYWHKRPDGLLGLTLRGEQRFRIVSREVQPNQLIMAEVELLPPAQPCPLDDNYQALVDMLRQIMAQLEPPYSKLVPEYHNATWVGSRLVELLPLKLAEKQKLLASDDARQRLDEIAAHLSGMDIL